MKYLLLIITAHLLSSCQHIQSRGSGDPLGDLSRILRDEAKSIKSYGSGW